MPCAVHPEIVTGLTTCSRCSREFCGDCLITLKGQPVCGSCKRDLVQDIRSGVKTDGLDLAHPGRRLAAQFIDGIVISFGSWVLGVIIILSCMPAKAVGLGIGLMYIAIFAFMICYEGFMLSRSRRGQTLGKMAMGIAVVTADGGKVGSAHAFKRAAARVILSIVPLLGLIDPIMVFSKERATLHDRSAATRVVRV